MINLEILNYVRQQLAQGVSKEIIKNDLIRSDWSEAEIDQVLIDVDAPNFQEVQTPISSTESSTSPKLFTNKSSFFSTILKTALILILILGGWYTYNLVVTNKIATSIKDSKETSLPHQLILEQTPYISNDTNFQMNFPKGWTVQQESINKVVVEANENDPIANIFVARTFNPDNIETQLKTIKELNDKKDQTIKFISKTALSLNIGEKSAYQLDFSDLTDKDKIIQSQIFIYFPNTLYIIQISTFESEWANNYKKLFESIIKTFKPLNIIEVSVDQRLEQTAYIDKSNGYQINLPKDWQIDPSAVSKRNGFGAAPKNAKKNNSVPFPNIILLIEPSSGQSLDEQINLAIQNDPAHPKIITKKTIKINGYDGFSLETTAIEKNNKLRQKSFTVNKSPQIYIIAGTALDSTWNDYNDLISASLSTFKLF